MSGLAVQNARAEALFATDVQRSGQPTPDQVRFAVQSAIRASGGRGSAARVATEFGDHPDVAVERMRWARRLVGEAFPAAQRADGWWHLSATRNRLALAGAGR